MCETLTIGKSFRLPKEQNPTDWVKVDYCLFHNGKEWRFVLCGSAYEGYIAYGYIVSTETDSLPWSSEVKWYDTPGKWSDIVKISPAS